MSKNKGGFTVVDFEGGGGWGFGGRCSFETHVNIIIIIYNTNLLLDIFVSLTHRTKMEE